MKKLYRHKHETGHGSPVVSGIFSGLGEWMEVSPGILRAGYVVLAILTWVIPAVLLYAVFHFLIPSKKE